MKKYLGVVLLSFAASFAFSQPAIVQRSPADYAASYDQQLPQPRQTLEERRLNKRVRQGAFARQLIKVLELEEQLPLTASEDDAIQLLRRLGISPLKGWKRFEPLTEDDYAVILGKAIGKEYLVHEKAQEVCDEIVDILNVEWQIYYQKNGRYPLLEKLIRDKSVFPGAEPRCPYGVPYKVVGYQPKVGHHKHFIKSPFKPLLYRERDYFQEWMASRRPGAEKKKW